MSEFLSLEDLLRIVEAAGLGPVRDVGLLDSAAHRPQTSMFGQDAYPDLASKAAALLHSLAHNQPLGDGNKRLAWLAMVVFFAVNGHLERAFRRRRHRLTAAGRAEAGLIGLPSG